MYQEISIFHKASASSRESGHLGSGGGIIGGPEGNRGSQHAMKCGGGGPLNFRSGFPGPSPDHCGGEVGSSGRRK